LASDVESTLRVEGCPLVLTFLLWGVVIILRVPDALRFGIFPSCVALLSVIAYLLVGIVGLIEGIPGEQVR
jgi:hypothetical protein